MRVPEPQLKIYPDCKIPKRGENDKSNIQPNTGWKSKSQDRQICFKTASEDK